MDPCLWVFLFRYISNKWFVERLKDLPEDSSDGLVFTHDEIDAVLGDNAVKILNL